MKTLLSIAFVGVLSLIIIISCVRSCVPVQQVGYGAPVQGYAAPAYNQPIVVHDNSGGGIVSHGLAAGAGYMLGKHAANAQATVAQAIPATTPAPAKSKWARSNRNISVAPVNTAPVNLSKPAPKASTPTKISGGSKWRKK